MDLDKDFAEGISPDTSLITPSEDVISDPELAPSLVPDMPSPNNSTVRMLEAQNLTPEQELPTGLKEYFNLRFADDKFSAAVKAIRGETVSDVDAYSERVATSAAELIGKFGIDAELFNDQRYAEAFLAASEFWTANSISTSPSDAEKVFISQFVRLLSGDHSSYNRDAIEQDDDAQLYIDTDEEDAKSEEKYQKYLARNDSEKAAVLRQRLTEKDEDSILNHVRGKLGVNPDAEKPYDVLVLDASQQRSLRDTSSGEKSRSSDWEELVDSTASAFVTYTAGHPPTIVISSDTYKDLSSEDQRERDRAIGLVAHEWGHTQRAMRIGHSTALGRNFDETMIGFASRGLGHYDAIVLYELMDHMAATEGTRIDEVFKESWKSDERLVDFYQYVANTFGPRSLLFLLATRPGNYTEPYGISSIPEFPVDSKEEKTAVFNHLVKDREAIVPGSFRAMHEEIEALPANVGTGLLLRANSAHIQLPESLKVLLRPKYKERMGVEYLG